MEIFIQGMSRSNFSFSHVNAAQPKLDVLKQLVSNMEAIICNCSKLFYIHHINLYKVESVKLVYCLKLGATRIASYMLTTLVGIGSVDSAIVQNVYRSNSGDTCRGHQSVTPLTSPKQES